jgi:hypothetical protein
MAPYSDQFNIIFMSGCTPTLLCRGYLLGTLSVELQQPGHIADHSSPSGAKVKNVCKCTCELLVYLHSVVIRCRRFLHHLSLLQIVSQYSFFSYPGISGDTRVLVNNVSCL